MESSSTLAHPPTHTAELLCNLQELHALFHPESWPNASIHEEKPTNMLPNLAFGFTPAFNWAGYSIPQYALTDVDSSSWIDKKPVLSHSLSKDSNPVLLSKDSKPLLPHGQIPMESCVEQMMATLIRNGGVDEVIRANPNMDMARILHKLGSFTHNVGLTVNSSKGGLSIHQGAQVLAPLIDPEFAKRAANLSCLSKQASFSSSSQLAQVAANPRRGDGGKLDSNSSGLTKAGSQQNLTRMPSELEPVCMGANIPNGCCVGLQGTVKQTVMVSPNAHAISQIKDEPMSMDKSDESFGQEASSLCERNGGCETTTERVNKGKNKRVKDRSKDDTARAPNMKDTETDEVKKGKCCKSGGEENQVVDSGDSTPLSGKESSEPLEPSKPDYIHVRARRGQATDSHSLAERVRREKISKRMKFLQDLVPGCCKVTGKALMLDEIINYVQSLQRQVEFLSMKLASVNPMPDFHMGGFFGKEIIQPQAIQHQALTMCAENPTSYSPYLHFSQHVHAPQQMVCPCPFVKVHSIGGLDMAARQTMSTSLASMDSYGDAVSQQLTQAWDEELQLVVQGPSPSSSLQGQPYFNGKMKIEL